ncbi:MAG: c-type cytochrome [Actinomycetota bacterium]|nr:c-type cytochrome [Actinomycetota bacterium]
MSSRPSTRIRRRRSLPGLAAVALALGLVGGSYAAFAPPTKAETEAATTTQIEEGRQLFLIGCSSCHGLQAQGGAQAPSLIGVGSAAVDFQVGTGRMPLMQQGPQAPRKPVRYTQEEIDAMSAYVASLAPGPKVPTAEQLDVSDGDIAEGGELFRTNCASCHNFSGQGGALTYGKEAPSLDPVTPKHIYEAMLTGPEQMPVFGDRAITPDEKRSIIAFIEGVKQEANPGGHHLGRLGPVPEGMVAWFIGIGGMVGMCLWIGSRA